MFTRCRLGLIDFLAVVAGEGRCIFIATTNAPKYLLDMSGNRRFLPVPCKQVNLRLFEGMRGQLFAAADFALNAMSRNWAGVTPGRALPAELSRKLTLPEKLWAEAAALNEERRVVHPGEDELPNVVEPLARSSVKTMSDGRRFIASSDLQRELRQRLGNPVQSAALAQWMRNLGWTSEKHGRATDQVRGYAK